MGEGVPCIGESGSQSLLTLVQLLNHSLLIWLAVSVLPLLFVVHSFLGPLILLDLLQGLHHLHEAGHLQQEAECLKTKGLPMSKAKNLYHVLKVAWTTELSISGNPIFSKRHRITPSATALDLLAEEHKGGMQGWESPPLPVPQHIVADISTEIASIYINIGDTQVYHSWAKGCCEGPSASCATIYTHVCHNHLSAKLSWPLFSAIF